MNEHVTKTGTTTIGLVTTDGVVLAADKRVTTGGGTIVGEFTKIVPVGERFAVTIAGTASDAIMLSRYLKAELKLKELRSSNDVTTREAANLLAQFVFSNIRQFSAIPGVTHFLMGGTDQKGVELYDIFPDGMVSEIPEYFCSGSGQVYAYGLIDAQYRKDMTVEEAVELAKKAIRSAIKRDTASGNGYDIVAITQDGVEKIESTVFENPIPK